MIVTVRANQAAAGVVLAAFVFAALGCEKAGAQAEIRLATTTSTEDSGLLGVLMPAFRKERGIIVHVIATGTGKALKHGENGDVDVVLVHAPEAEEQFVEAGFGVMRRRVMHNDFVVLGPPADPAGIRGATGAAEAFRKIAGATSADRQAGAVFVSRGDDSGTHKKEQALWRAAGVEPAGAWYLSAGQGMGACLTIADEKRAYVLADRGTWLKRHAQLGLEVLAEGDPALFNPYSVIAVNPARHPRVKAEAAREFIEWLVSPGAQRMIGDYAVDGGRLFHPDAVDAGAR